MNIYKVFRPYCSPGVLIILAESRIKAIKISNKSFGFVDGTTARLISNKKAKVLLACDLNNNIDPRYVLPHN